MPFTLAHPALVIPLCKYSKRISFTAIIIGSIIPDVEFFIQLREVNNLGHHWYGILLFDLPAAILICYLFHNLLRNRMLESLPEVYRNRLLYLKDFNWNLYIKTNKLKVLISLIIGIISHLYLDAFTHHDGIFVEVIPVLSKSITLFQYSAPIYFMLQILLSLIGLYIVHLQILKLPENIVPFRKSPSNNTYPFLIGVLSIAILLIRILFWPQYNTFGGICIAVMGSIMYSWILISIIYKYKN